LVIVHFFQHRNLRGNQLVSQADSRLGGLQVDQAEFLQFNRQFSRYLHHQLNLHDNQLGNQPGNLLLNQPDSQLGNLLGNQVRVHLDAHLRNLRGSR